MIETPNGQMLGIGNEQGELAGLKFKCKATSKNEAFNLFHSAISPGLDHLSYIADVPVVIEKAVCIDMKNKTTSLRYVAPYQTVTIPSEPQEPSELLMPIYALYREAKNNNSDYYRFLCYFKIMEGIYNSICPQLRKKLKK